MGKKTSGFRPTGLLLLLGAMAVLPLACATALPHATPESLSRADRMWPGTRLEDLEMGRRDYVAHCAACHHLHLPSEFTSEKWTAILVKMQRKAKIDDSLKDSIYRYLASESRPISLAEPGG
jgi:Dihaem cytochrome c